MSFTYSLRHSYSSRTNCYWLLMSSKRQCPDSDGQSPLKKPNVKRMDISLNQDSLLAENDLNTDVEEQPQDITENMEDTDEISDSGAISMDEENGEVDSIKIQNIIKKALMENEKKMDAYKQEMTEEIKTLRSQIQTQTLKMDDMKLRLEMIGIHVPADVTNVSFLCESSIKRQKCLSDFWGSRYLLTLIIWFFSPLFTLEAIVQSRIWLQGNGHWWGWNVELIISFTKNILSVWNIKSKSDFNAYI